MTAPSSQDPVIELIDADIADIHDPRLLILEKVRWTVCTGDFWVVAGMNRSGKSALLNTAAGLVPPQRGLCKLFGYDTRYPNDNELRVSRIRLGFVFEGGQMLHGLKVWENISLPLRYHRNLTAKQALQQIKPLLEFTGLGPWSNAYKDRMGRHWQQRVGLARALVLQPQLLLLDNPIAGLDPEEVQWWITTLQNLAEGNLELIQKPVTIVLTSSSFNYWRAPRRRYAILRSRGLHVLEGEAEVSPSLPSNLAAGSFVSPDSMND